jgi:tRNA pseudouridine38-40 synthase
VRLAVGIEYAGTRYAGWQRQAHANSVQAEVERALGLIADHPVAIQCAGRTDAGVHALGQVAHFDTEAIRLPRNWLIGTNGRLPEDVALGFVAEVPAAFHARYSALERTYRYLILNRDSRSAVLADRVLWRHHALDVPRMHQALQALVGTHDFSAFRAAECQAKQPVRELRSILATRAGDLITVEVTANAFLHHMVRNIVGSALMVATGERPAGWLAELLASRDRRLAGPTAPPGGLYFAKVQYPAEYRLPEPALGGLSAMIGGLSGSLERG